MSRPPDGPTTYAYRHRHPLRTPEAASARHSTRTPLSRHNRLTFSIITQYEILRGLRAKQAHAQETAFAALCQVSLVLPLTERVIERVATLYGELYRRGELIADADLLIAATALDEERILVTNNLAHFQRIPGLSVANWKQYLLKEAGKRSDWTPFLRISPSCGCR
jgi:tRNA(fMet)-specific endonuclease VapC